MKIALSVFCSAILAAVAFILSARMALSPSPPPVVTTDQAAFLIRTLRQAVVKGVEDGQVAIPELPRDIVALMRGRPYILKYYSRMTRGAWMPRVIVWPRSTTSAHLSLAHGARQLGQLVKFGPKELPPGRFRLDLVTSFAPASPWWLYLLARPLESGRDGIIVRKGKRNVVSLLGIDLRDQGRGLAHQVALARQGTGVRVRTLAFLEDPQGALPTWRVSILVPPPQREHIKAASQRAARWLMVNQRQDGSFPWWRAPGIRGYRDSTDTPLSAHALAVTALAEAARLDPTLMDGLTLATAHLVRMVLARTPGELTSPEAGVALTALATAVGSSTQSGPWVEDATGLVELLGDHLSDLITPDGLVLRSPGESGDSPLGAGRAIVALLAQAPLSPHPQRCIDLALKVGRLYAGPRWQAAGLSLRPIPNPWIIQGLAQLVRHHGARDLAEPCLAMGEELVRLQVPEGQDPDLVGALFTFGALPYTSDTASRTRALKAAASLARHLGQANRAGPLEDAVTLAMGFLITHQYREESVGFLSETERFEGGVVRNPLDPRITLESTGLALLALIEALEGA